MKVHMLQFPKKQPKLSIVLGDIPIGIFCLLLRFHPADMDKPTLFDQFVAKKVKMSMPNLAILAADEAIPATRWHMLCYDQQDASVAFRAAWALEYIATHYPERFVPVFMDFLFRLPSQGNPSCQRHFTKILMLITHAKAPERYRDLYLRADRERLVETIFGWLIEPQTPVAVQVNCLDILFNMTPEFPWIKDELKQQTEFFLRDGSAAMQSRGKKILAKLKKVKIAG